MTTMVKMTPMLQQYLEIKEQFTDAILFYRMGDFYEMFFEDAETASKILGITLTSRSSKDDEHRVPMCGIPYHAASGYLAKLVKAGLRVAICEQAEDPATAKGIVKREVVRVLSPGVVTDQQILDDRSNNYVCAITRSQAGKTTILRSGLSRCQHRRMSGRRNCRLEPGLRAHPRPDNPSRPCGDARQQRGK